MPSFTLRSARPYMKYCVFYSYPNDDTETATFDRTVLIVLAMLTTSGGLRLSCPSKPVSVYDWLKNGFVTHEVNAEVAYTT